MLSWIERSHWSTYIVVDKEGILFVAKASTMVLVSVHAITKRRLSNFVDIRAIPYAIVVPQRRQ
jgi:hypothetical protein